MKGFSNVSGQAPEIKGFTLIKKLGSGKSADVYLANQECFDRQVALKILHPALNADSAFKQRFMEKIKKIKQLSHPNLLEVYSIGESNDYSYIVSEYIPEGNLGQKLASAPPLTAEECASIFTQVSETLSYCHAKGLLHGNLHNNKIYLRSNGKIAISDYALARAQIKGKLFSSIYHISPEQLQGKKSTKAVDFYAMGICCYQALTGQYPFTGNSAKAIAALHLQQEASPLPENVASFQTIINGLLTKDPATRISSHEQLLPLLKQINQSGSPRELKISATDDFELDGDQSTTTNEEELVLPTMPNNETPWSRILVVIFILAIIAGAAWYAYQYSIMSNLDNTPIEPVAEAPVAEVATENPGQARINRLLEKAEALMRQGNFLRPIGNNAYGKYQSVLEADKENALALEGIKRIAAHFIDQAREQLQENQLKLAQESINNAKAVDDSIPGLQELQAELDSRYAKIAADKAERAKIAAAQKQAQAKKAQAERARIAAEKKRIAEEEARLQRLAEEERLMKEAQALSTKMRLDKLKVNGLLNKANTYFKRGEYRSPAKENALEKYLEVLAIAPDNSAAQTGLHKVVDTMIPEIEGYLSKQQYSMAKNLYDQAIEASPNHERLKALGQSKGW